MPTNRRFLPPEDHCCSPKGPRSVPQFGKETLSIGTFLHTGSSNPPLPRYGTMGAVTQSTDRNIWGGTQPTSKAVIADACGSSAKIHAMNSRSVESFYDGLAGEYHLIFGDWWSAGQRHSNIVATLLAAEGVDPPSAVLDCTCGIGTQALPLAAHGYCMTGTDLSGTSIARATTEADSRDIPIDLSVADVRRLPTQFDRRFKAVISCDNALPHLLNDEDLVAALCSIHRTLVKGGLFLASIRDYDTLRSERSKGIPPTIMGIHGSRHGYAQSWEWSHDGSQIDISLFVLHETPDAWSTSVHETTYRALLRAEMDAALVHTKFSQIRWLMPEVTGYYQPIVIARSAL